MYAKNDQGIINAYVILPSDWNKHINFRMADIEVLNSEGFFEIIDDPTPENKERGSIYIDYENKVARYNFVDIPTPVWHDETKPIQLIISDELKKEWILKNQENEFLGNYPEIAQLLSSVKSINCPKVQEKGNLYLYLNEIYPDHEAILKSFSVIINKKNT
jgi:hypothetical protein